MTTPISGGCLCGAVRYQSSVEPLITANCHCRDCQRATGSGYAPTLFVPTDSLTVTGELKFHAVKGDSGHSVSRGFCPICGSQLCGQVELMSGLTALRAGSLDDPAAFKPTMDIYVASAQPWDHMDPALPKFDKLPPQP
ncbi:MAG: GFA family protein [Methylococcaceae bacterium]|nr:GFA family protein [Methylococcaceae bacterium]